MILAIDPGNEESAWCVYNGESPLSFAKEPNDKLRDRLRLDIPRLPGITAVAIEMIASYGMAVGAPIFETCVWIGRFMELAPAPVTLVYRAEVKLHLCHSMKAKHANVRAALMDKWGGTKERAIGTKKAKGPLYGIGGDDLWSALGVAVTWWETKREAA